MPKSLPPFPADDLRRFHRRSVLITSSEGQPITSGELVLVEPLIATEAANLTVEFTLRGVAFVIAVPPDQLLKLAATWNSHHFVFALPPGERLWLSPSDAGN